MTVTLTCDRQDGLWRAAVWHGKELRDLYLDRIDEPDMTGAVVVAKVNRLAPNKKAAWCDAGMGMTVYVDNPKALRSGDVLALRITGAARHGKACSGAIADHPVPEKRLGVIVDPPRPWARAIHDLKEERPSRITFADRQDHEDCEKFLQTRCAALLPALQPRAGAPHPELDDMIEALTRADVPLSGGASIVIEQTEALAAIDVNSGESVNALDVNLRAVKEIARQMRLRNLSGIIVIDAMKMNLRPDKAKVLNALQKAVVGDPRRVDVFGFTKLGLIELTRQRRGPSLGGVLQPRG